MKQKHCNTEEQKYTHLKESDRYKIEVYLDEKKTIHEIATKLGRVRSTIWREIKRGSINRMQSDLTYKKQYRANFAQNDYRNKAKNKERNLKIGKDTKYFQKLHSRISPNQ